MDELDQLRESGAQALARAGSLTELEQAANDFLGRKGRVAGLMRLIPGIAASERPAFGQRVNELKRSLQAVVDDRRAELAAAELDRKLADERVDVTRPGRTPAAGRPHPITVTLEQAADLMRSFGFRQTENPEVEEYRFNFAALNFAEEHPALDEQASFYIDDRLLLRTHTTGFQGRLMPELDPPFAVFTCGRCFRYEAIDATHHHTFHQVDGVRVGRDITLADLAGTLTGIARCLFGAETEVRLRPDFFPFVEPGLEIAVKLPGRWLELGGAGMIHPNVLRWCGINPDEWSGFAFGLGVDRMPMVQHGISDIRTLWENDQRLLRSTGMAGSC